MNSDVEKYKILLSGGGTGGSAAPLLAIYDELKSDSKFEFLWLGTKFGPEKQMVASASSALGAGIKFMAISGGKWRRYFSFKNLVDLIKIKIGFWQAFWIMLKWRPALVMSAGSFISVPVVWAAWLLGVPALIHQQDARPGLANKLMAPFAKIITVTFEKSLADYGKKAVWTGNPIRNQLKIDDHELPINNFNLQKDLPVVLIVGGGSGAMAINELVAESLAELTKFCQIIHVTGKNKAKLNIKSKINNYRIYEFLDSERMAEALWLADIVVTRAGMGFLTELSFLGKPAIIIPLPDSHQTENAMMFKDAGLVLGQKGLTAERFTRETKNLIADRGLRGKLSQNITRVMKPGANRAVVNKILEILKYI